MLINKIPLVEYINGNEHVVSMVETRSYIGIIIGNVSYPLIIEKRKNPFQKIVIHPSEIPL